LFAGEVAEKSKKKRYAGYVVWEGGRWLEENEKYIHVAGFESKRSNSSDMTTEVQMKTFEDLLIHHKNARQVMEYWSKLYEEICNGKHPIVRCVPSPSLSKSPEDYERNTVHAVAAKYSNNNLPSVGKFHRGDRVYYVYVKKVPEGFPETHVIGLKADSELPKDFEPDWQAIADKAIKNVFIKLAASLKIPVEAFEALGGV
jgi:DNA polymerase elongation subunit (family B)